MMLRYKWEDAYKNGIINSTEFLKEFRLKLRSYSFEDETQTVELGVEEISEKLPEWIKQK